MAESNSNAKASSKSCRGMITSPLHARVVSGAVGSIITSLVVTPLEVVKVRQQALTLELAPAASLPPHVSPCPKGCGTFVLNNGLRDCVLPKSAASFFDSSGRLTASAKAIFTSTNPSELGTFSMMRRIFKSEGFSGIYAGIRPTLVMAMPNTVLYFSAYDELVWRLRKSASDPSQSWIPLVSGGSARLLSSTFTAPFEFLRTRQASLVGAALQSNRGGIIAEFRLIVEKEGFRALYQGLGSTLWRDVPFSAIYWLSIERLREVWKRNNATAPVSPSQQAMQAFINGAVSGMIAACITTPFDVVKTRMQQQVVETVTKNASQATPSNGVVCGHGGAAVFYDISHASLAAQLRSAGTFHYLRHIAETEGIQGLWRGNRTRMIKIAPACAIMISSYELGKRILE